MKKSCGILFFLIAIQMTAMAQVDLTMYNMRSIHQSTYVNPASMPNTKISIGLPAISSVYIYISNSGFAFSDLITKRSDDSLVLDLDRAISKMADKNFITQAFAIDLFSFGIRVKKNYFSINITEKENFNFTYTKDFFNFLQNGNSPFVGKNADFNGMGLDGNHYREYGLSMAREINTRLSIGGRIKYLYGMENISTAKSNFSLYTDETTYELSLTSGAEINTATLENSAGGYSNMNITDYLFKQKNTGYGLDLGGQYQLNKHWNFSLSMIDLGFIKWKSNVKNYTINNVTSQFAGIDLGQFVGDTSESTQSLLDSLANSFKAEETRNAYTTHLSTQVYAGANYYFNEKSFAGMLLRGQFFKGMLIPSATLSLNHRFGKNLSMAVSYSALNRTYNNIGFGLATNAGPVQFYFASDNVMGLIQPLDARTFNAHLGFNVILGRKPKDRDGDKVPDKADACPDVSGLASLKGCPDQDSDGIADKDDACPYEAGVAETHGCPDKDVDGIADKIDACPEIAGLAVFNGCPDTDGDSIPDNKDACPDVAGLPQFNGCPDTDGDHITDLEDRCPDSAGLAKNQGCPDADEDGIIDQKDHCPLVAGPASNNGCPVIENNETTNKPVRIQLTQEEQNVMSNVFQNLEFETGKSILRESSYSSLDSLTNLLKKRPSFKLLVDGHSDNVGAKVHNQQLSQGRADAVKKYLTDKGIDDSRIIPKGYGDSMPLVSNNTPEGRSKNRRVEFTIME